MKKWRIIKSLNLSGKMNILIVQILCLCVILHSYENPYITCRRHGVVEKVSQRKRYQKCRRKDERYDVTESFVGLRYVLQCAKVKSRRNDSS